MDDRDSSMVKLLPKNITNNMITGIAGDDNTDVHRKPKKVYIHVAYLKFGEVNTLTEKFDADVLVRSKWKEPRLKRLLKDNQVNYNEINWDELWNPKIFIENATWEPKITSSKVIDICRDGHLWVIERKRFKGTFMETLELGNFPFDIQDLSVFVKTERPVTDVILIEDPKEMHIVNRQNFIDEQEWYLYNYVESAIEETTKDPLEPATHCSVIMVRAKAARRPAYFLFNNFLVTFMITALAFTTFSVEPKLPQNRLQLSFTLVLTAVAFKFVVNQSLPKLSYLTYLDYYVLACVVMLISLSVWHSFQMFVPLEYYPLVDLIGIAVFGGIYIIFNICFWISILVVPYKKRRKMKEKELAYMVKKFYISSQAHHVFDIATS